MEIKINSEALQWTSIATLVLALKIVYVMLALGHSRVYAGRRAPEDSVVFSKAGVQSFDGSLSDKKDNPKYAEKFAKYQENEQRWVRIMANDLENIPIGLIIAWGSLFSCYSPVLHKYLVAIFAVARVAHTIAFANKVMLPRSAAWFAGLLCFLALSVNGVIGSFAVK